MVYLAWYSINNENSFIQRKNTCINIMINFNYSYFLPISLNKHFGSISGLRRISPITRSNNLRARNRQ